LRQVGAGKRKRNQNLAVLDDSATNGRKVGGSRNSYSGGGDERGRLGREKGESPVLRKSARKSRRLRSGASFVGGGGVGGGRRKIRIACDSHPFVLRGEKEEGVGVEGRLLNRDKASD